MSFDFYNPTKIVFGKNRENEIGELIREKNLNRVLVLCGKNSARQSGLLDKLIQCLRDSGISYELRAGVKPNPVIRFAQETVQMVRDNRCDSILAIGGGSVIDTAKAVAAAAVNNENIWDIMTGKVVPQKSLPVFCILTLAATGSEMNDGFVLTNEDKCLKLGAGTDHSFPVVSILNPELTYTVSKEQTAYGIVDAMSHCLEVYFSSSHMMDFTNRYIENICITMVKNADIVMKHPENYDARSQIMWGAAMALNGLPVAGALGYSFPNHLIEHSLSGLYDIPHGAGLAIVMPAWMKWYHTNNPRVFERFSREIFARKTAEEGILALESFFQNLGVPLRLKDVNIFNRDIEKIALNARTLSKKWQLDKFYTTRKIIEILTLAL